MTGGLRALYVDGAASGTRQRERRRDEGDSPPPQCGTSATRGAAVYACIACGQRWLVTGLDVGEIYSCKSCGHRAEPVDTPMRADWTPGAGPQRSRDGVRRHEERKSTGRAPEE